ncbi:ABC transporter ATP-binding protein [Enterococcus sp. AZ103]|uniref:ABC transporter ATP-binding protein n=1 Tax=Enterococcus sp. AZ103 TaxID=2774628 RepID=UPI003F21718C
MTGMIQINQVSKNFKATQVVSGVNMTIKEGEIYGFLGPNGAGKTTIMKMILNLIKPTTGEIRVENELIQKNSYQYLKNIGNIIETPVFYQQLTAEENLSLHAEYMGKTSSAKISEVLKIVGLEQVRNKLVTEFSLGMRQRLGIARAILTEPKILILDEPINGLDPIGIKEIRELLLYLKQEKGMTILISSHIVSEIEWIADTIGVIDQGQLLKEVRMSDIRAQNTSHLMVEVDQPEKALEILQTKLGIQDMQQTHSRIQIYDQQVDQSLVTQMLVKADIRILKIEQNQESLEEYFLNMIGKGK